MTNFKMNMTKNVHDQYRHVLTTLLYKIDDRY